MNIYQFMDLHPVLSWCLAWGGLAAFLYTLACVIRIVVRLIRSINICVRGWPPEHLDADGDFKIETKVGA